MKELKVHGSLLKGFAEACVNLKIVAGIQSKELVHNVNTSGWYPLSHFQKLQQQVLRAYDNSSVILETVGEAMMQGWYEFGPGKDLIENGVGFLHFQSGSEGFISVVKGPNEFLGSFELSSLSLEQGTAVIHSTTPFDKDMERGIIIGGMLSPGDITYVDVDNSENSDIFQIKFIQGNTSQKEWNQFFQLNKDNESLKQSNLESKDLWWQYKGLQKKWQRAVDFWQATNANLLQAYEKLDRQSNEVGQIFYKAGMADATIDVIHNIGNSINNVTTSAELIGRILLHSKIEEIIKVSNLLEMNSENLADFLTQDKRGNKIIEYLKMLGTSLENAASECQMEVRHIQEGAFNIEKILSAQRIYLEADNVFENFNIVTTIEGALRLQSTYLEQYDIQIIKLFLENDILTVSGHQSKLISVLLELFKNSVEAMSKNDPGNRVLKISLSRSKTKVVLEINDNGEGVLPDNFNTIFNHGFTTRENRYGFGLHNSANYIAEMGGKIMIVQSNEKDGTTFKIELKSA